MSADHKKRLGRGLTGIIASGRKAELQPGAAPVVTATAPSSAAAVPDATPQVQAPAKPWDLVFAEIPVAKVESNPHQPRKEFSQEMLGGLAESIRQEGVLQPIVVRPTKTGGYQLVAGERRWRAVRMLGIKTIPARIIQASDATSASIALIENLQREGLNPMEEAEGYASLMRDFDFTQEEVGERVGKSRAGVANSLRLLTLDKEVQGFVAKGQVSLGHAKVILGLDQKPQQVIAARKVIENGLSVRATEALVQAIREGRDAGSRDATKDASKRQDAAVEQAVRDIEKRVSSLLGTRVQVQHGRRRGKLVIEYHGDDDLERILSAIGVAAK